MSTQHVEDNHELSLIKGLCAELIDERLRSVCRLSDVGHRATAFYLADLHTRGLHQALGMPTTVAYAVRSLGMSRRQARELLDAGRRLQELTRIDAAFAASELSWSRVRRVCEVATPDTEEAWLTRAMTSTQDELDRLVRGTHRGDAPPSGGGLPRARFALHAELDAVQWQMFENARAKLQAELGYADELRDADIITEMLRLVLASDADGTVPGRTAVDGGPFRVLVREGDANAAPAPAGPAGEATSAPALVGRDGDEALAAARFDAIASTGATPPWLRAKVLARDGHACKNCGSRRALHAHHVVWRSQGGPTVLDNLQTLCNRCHGLVHDGFLEVEVAQCATLARPKPQPEVAASSVRADRGCFDPATGWGPSTRESSRDVTLPGSSDPSADRVAFVFFDMHGRRVDRRSCAGAQISLRAAEGPEVAQCATSRAPCVSADGPCVTAAAQSPALDVRWLASHLDWFDARGGGFTLKPQFRERFEQELGARPARSRKASSVA